MKWLRATCALFLLPSIVLAATPSNPPPVTNGVLVWYWDGTKSVVVTPTAPLPTTATISGSVTVNSAASAATSPPTYSAGANPLSQNLSGGLRVQISLSGTDIGVGQQVKAASIPVAIASDQTVPVSGAVTLSGTITPTARTAVTSTSLEANHVITGAAGSLYSFEVQADSTLSAAAWWIMVYNATSAPVDGAVTPIKCYQMASGTLGASYAFPNPIAFSTGITIGVSTTGCLTKTASAHAIISGDF